MSAIPAIAPQRHRLSVMDYYRMAEAGIFSPGARIELIEGEIYDMSPIGVDHAYIVRRLTAWFAQKAGDSAVVSVQNPIRLDLHSEPQPDIALLRFRPDYYRHAHPGALDVILLVEVADSSLRYDLEVKLPLYARHGIPEVWVIDLPHRRLEIHRRPQGQHYVEKHCPLPGETIAAPTWTDSGFKLEDLL